MQANLVEPVKDVAVLAMPGCYLSSAGALTDGFALVARQVLAMFAPPYATPMQTRVRLLTVDGAPLQFAGGREMASDGDLQGGAAYRIVYLPAFVGGGEEALFTLLDHARPLLDWLYRQRAQGAVIGASGTSVTLLAESGLLDGGKAAVLEPLRSLFKRRYRKVRVDARAALAEHQGLHTCSAPAAEWALVARLVEQAISPMSAQWLATTVGMPADRRDSPASSDDPLVASAQFWLAQRFAQDLRISELAAALAVSHATLLRRFERSLGMTPGDYARRLRVESGKRMLQSTRRPIEQVAVMVGYADVRAFRAVFKAHTGMSPTEFRAGKRGDGQGRAPER